LVPTLENRDFIVMAMKGVTDGTRSLRELQCLHQCMGCTCVEGMKMEAGFLNATIQGTLSDSHGILSAFELPYA